MNNFKHEQLVKNFLKSKGLPETYLHYDNVLIYTRAKYIMKSDYISKQDYNQLNKFCKRWVQLKGKVNLKHIRRIQSIIKYNKIKEQGKLHNSYQKQLRFAKKIKKLTKTV